MKFNKLNCAISQEAFRNCPSVIRGKFEFIGKRQIIQSNIGFSMKETEKIRGLFSYAD